MIERIGTLAVARSVADLRRAGAAWRDAGDSVALVPTMGALHAGHLALLVHASSVARRTIASIFVNPTQFGAGEDFTVYPRDETGDAAKLAAAGCDLLYAPAAAEMYPAGFSVGVSPGALAEPLDGRFRPGHFAGVATVVTKLLLQAQADIACFGEKDWQQLQIVRRLVRDLDIPVRIDGVPIVREADGLALSSRNAYLAPGERAAAPVLHRTLTAVARRVAQGEAPDAAASWGGGEVLRAGFAALDYLEVCDAETLAPFKPGGGPGRVLVAARIGKTRLIDNEPVP